MDRRDWKAKEFENSDLVRISNFRKKFNLTENASRRRSIEPEYYKWKLLNSPYQKDDFFFV
jgi:hypothetical protein